MTNPGYTQPTDTPAGTLDVTDSRTNQSYQLPIAEGSIRAADLIAHRPWSRILCCS